MLVQAAFRNVARNPRRTITTMIAVALGVWSLLFLAAFNTGALERLREVTIHARHGHGQVARRGYFDEVYEKPHEHWIDKGADVEAKLRAIPGVAATFPRVSFPALLTNGHVSIGALGQGVDAAKEAGFFNALNIEDGVPLTDQSEGVVLGKGLAASLGVKPGDVVTVLGQTVNGTTNSTELVVAGIFHVGSPDFDDRVFRMQIKEAQSFLDTDQVESIAVALADDRDAAWAPFAAAVSAAMPELGAKSFAQLDEVNYVHMRDWLLSQAGVFEAIIAMLVFFGVVNTVAAAVLDRRQEIGTLRANGESRGEVLALFALEASVAAAAGVIAGVALHLVVAHVLLAKGILLPPPSGMTRPLLVFLHTEAKVVARVSVTAIAITVVGAGIASVRAVRTPIAEALRAV